MTANYIISFYIVIDNDLENIPRLASITTDKKIIPVAPQPDKPTSSFPILQREKVTQITTPIPKKTKIDGGKINPNIAKESINIA
jgi:hypothetical protein